MVEACEALLELVDELAEVNCATVRGLRHLQDQLHLFVRELQVTGDQVDNVARTLLRHGNPVLALLLELLCQNLAVLAKQSDHH